MSDVTLALEIEGMTSEQSAQLIQDALRRERGIKDIQVDWCCGVGAVVFDADQTDQERILASAAFQGEYRARVGGGGCC